jgi:hypothetical protein
MNDLRSFVMAYVEPGRDPTPIAVLLFNPATNRLLMRWSDNYDNFGEDAKEILPLLAADISGLVQRLGACEVLDYFLDTLSNTLLISEAHTALESEPQIELDRLFDEYVRCR